MNSFLWVAFGTAILISLILVGGYIAIIAIKPNNNNSDNLAEETLESNAQLKIELTAINEELASISKMMKEVG